MRTMLTAAAVLVVTLAFLPARAQVVTELTVRPTGVDAVDFGQFNLLPNSQQIPTPQRFESFGGIDGNLDEGPLYIEMQCCTRLNSLTGQATTSNFMMGDWLIYTNTPGSAILIHFRRPVHLVGTQLSNNYGGPFIAKIEAFSGRRSLGTFTENGNNTATADNTAIFLGVTTTTAAITDVIYTVTDPSGAAANVAINQIAVNQ
jgi:hypothetical protein